MDFQIKSDPISTLIEYYNGGSSSHLFYSVLFLKRAKIPSKWHFECLNKWFFFVFQSTYYLFSFIVRAWSLCVRACVSCGSVYYIIQFCWWQLFSMLFHWINLIKREPLFATFLPILHHPVMEILLSGILGDFFCLVNLLETNRLIHVQ